MKRVLALLLVWAASAVAREEIISLTQQVQGPGEQLQEVTYRYYLDTPDSGETRAVLLVFPGGNGDLKLREEGGRIWHNQRRNFFSVARTALKAQGFAIAFMEKPSNMHAGFPWKARREPAHARDLEPAAADLKRRMPGAKLVASGFAAGAISALLANAELPELVDASVLIGAPFLNLRAHDLSRVKKPVLALHHLQTLCEFMPYHEAARVAAEYRFALVAVGSTRTFAERSPCALGAVGSFAGFESDALRILKAWVEGEAPAPSLNGAANVPALNETVEMISGPGGARLELTLYRPNGPGPFPLVLLTHGIPLDKAEMVREKRRTRYARQAQEFVQRGLAVALVMRRGYGYSDGRFNAISSRRIAEFADRDADDLRAALDHLAAQPFVDRDRVVVGGQSGGALAAIALGAKPNVPVRGLLNFAGGLRSESVPNWRQHVVNGFAKMGATSSLPSIWIYSANDRLFDHPLAEAMHEAYTKAGGGPVRLIKLPGFKRDGHHVFPDPEGIPLWWPEAEKFLRELQLLG